MILGIINPTSIVDPRTTMPPQPKVRGPRILIHDPHRCRVPFRHYSTPQIHPARVVLLFLDPTSDPCCPPSYNILIIGCRLVIGTALSAPS